MKRKLSFLLALVFVLTLAFGVLPTAGAAASDYTLDQKIDPITHKTYSYAGSNIIVIKQANYTFIWKDGTITDNDTTLKSIVAGLDSSVNTSKCNITTSTTFWLDDFGSLDGDPQYLFKVTINTSTMQVTIQKYEWQWVKTGKHTGYWDKFEVDGFVSHIDLISYDPPGSLKIIKDVETSGAPNATFPITVVFSNSVTAPSGVTNLGNNTYSFNLSDNNYKTFTNIPIGTTYTVSEGTLPTNWFNDNETGELSGTIENSSLKTVCVENIYKMYGTLDVTKDVLTSGAPGASFNITVTFTGSNLGDILLNGDGTNDTGIYILSLSDNQTAHFTQIPKGTVYTVVEQLTQSQMDAGWKTPTYYFDDTDLVKAIDSDKDDDNVTVKNTYSAVEVGKLVVSKIIAGEDADPDQPFTILVNLANAGNGLSNVQYQTDGTVVKNSNTSYTLTLKGGQSVTFTNVPNNTTYSVSEINVPDNWTASPPVYDDPTDKEIETENPNEIDAVTITNTYSAPPVVQKGTLIIDKTVSGTNANADLPFDITVVFSGDVNLSEIQSSISTSTPGTYTFSLSANGTPVTFSNIPMNTHYLVSEATPADDDWSLDSITPNDADISSSQPITVVVNNVYDYTPEETDFGSLTVAKQVSQGASTTEKFEFTVTFYFEDSLSIEIVKSNANIEVIDNGDGSYTLYLAHGEFVTFKGLIDGVSYTVEETISEAQSTEGWYTENGEFEGSIGYNDGLYDHPAVTVYNIIPTTTNPPTPVPPPPVVINTASLTVTKTVSGDVDEAPAASFEFTVTFTPGAPDFWNVLGIDVPDEAAGSNGTFTFSLSAGQSITFSNIPVGTTYTVTETTILADGWTAGTVTGATGSIGANGAAATIDNVYTVQEVAGASDSSEPSEEAAASDEGGAVAGDVDVLPQTGGISPATLLGIFGLILIAIGGTVFTILRKKENGKSKS
jgi:LPXTG-motif cell wall-anchored protein